MLAKTTFGDEKAKRLLIAHGLFGSARNWGVLARRLSQRLRVIVPDMRNHGQSPWFDSHTYHEMAQDLAELAGARMSVLGHSMGGKAAMMLALTRPELIERLIVADIAPVPYAHEHSGIIEAMRALDLRAIERRADARDALRVEDNLKSFLLQSLDLRERRWRLNLDVLERDMAAIVGFPPIEARYEGPVLFLSGARSGYVLPEHRARIKELFPRARFARIPGAGHWLHADEPRAFEESVRVFLEAAA